MNTTPTHTPAPIDPTAIIKERKERETTEAAHALLAKQAEQRKLNLEHANEVPALVDQAVADLDELFKLYTDYDSPAFTRAMLTDVLDHEATAAKATADAQSEQLKKRPLWKRLLPKAPTLGYQLNARDKLIISQARKEVACWVLGSITRPGPETRMRMLYLEVQTGTVYATPASISEGLYADVLDPEAMKRSLTYIEAKEFAELVHSHIVNVQMHLRWAREDAERAERAERDERAQREARLNEVPTQHDGDDS